MSDLDLSKDPIRPDDVQPRKTGWGWKPVVFAGFIAIAGIGGMVTARAIDGHGFGPHRWMSMHGGPGFGPMGGPFHADPAAIEDRADKGIRHLAIEIDATAEQQEKLRTIGRALVKDLVPLRDARRDTTEKLRSLLTAPTVDKAALESFRAEQVTKMDAVSKRITQAITEVSDVLTPEQRRKLADRLPPPGGPFGGPR